MVPKMEVGETMVAASAKGKQPNAAAGPASPKTPGKGAAGLKADAEQEGGNAGDNKELVKKGKVREQRVGRQPSGKRRVKEKKPADVEAVTESGGKKRTRRDEKASKEERANKEEVQPTYELERIAIMEQNRQRMLELGIFNLSSQFVRQKVVRTPKPKPSSPVVLRKSSRPRTAPLSYYESSRSEPRMKGLSSERKKMIALEKRKQRQEDRRLASLWMCRMKRRAEEEQRLARLERIKRRQSAEEH